jgi:hypothetical protein
LIGPLIGLSTACILVYTLVGIPSATAQERPMQDMYPSKAAADRRDKQLKCTADFKMAGGWMPCKSMGEYEKSINKEKR